MRVSKESVLERSKGSVEFSKAVSGEKWEMTAPEGEGVSMSSVNEDMLNHLPEELLESISTMKVEYQELLESNVVVEYDKEGNVEHVTYPEQEMYEENRELSEFLESGKQIHGAHMFSLPL